MVSVDTFRVAGLSNAEGLWGSWLDWVPKAPLDTLLLSFLLP